MQGKCYVCKETGDPDDDRCQAGVGIRQRCMNGKVCVCMCLCVYIGMYDSDNDRCQAGVVFEWRGVCMYVSLCICRYV